MIRYADLLLWKAEAVIENGDLETGRAYINEVRTRAVNSERVKMLDGSTEAANYRIAPYETSFDSYDKAIETLRNERRLEMAHEGHRFFDLVRWGMAADVLNDYLKIEKTRRTHLTGASFVAGKHEYMPIPQSQIDLGREMIEQTEGY